MFRPKRVTWLIRGNDIVKAYGGIFNLTVQPGDGFRKFVHNYPEDEYVKVGYIEVLQYNHGPKAALDY